MNTKFTNESPPINIKWCMSYMLTNPRWTWSPNSCKRGHFILRTLQIKWWMWSLCSKHFVQKVVESAVLVNIRFQGSYLSMKTSTLQPLDPLLVFWKIIISLYIFTMMRVVIIKRSTKWLWWKTLHIKGDLDVPISYVYPLGQLVLKGLKGCTHDLYAQFPKTTTRLIIKCDIYNQYNQRI